MADNEQLTKEYPCASSGQSNHDSVSVARPPGLATRWRHSSGGPTRARRFPRRGAARAYSSTHPHPAPAAAAPQVEVVELPSILPAALEAAAESDNDDSGELDGPSKKYRKLCCSEPPPEVGAPA